MVTRLHRDAGSGPDHPRTERLRTAVGKNNNGTERGREQRAAVAVLQTRSKTLDREIRKRLVGTTGALMLVSALSGVTAIIALSYVSGQGAQVREASDHLVSVSSLRQRLLGLFTAAERVVVAQEGFDRFTEMQAAVAKAREQLRVRTAGTYLTADVAVLDRDTDDLRIAIQQLESRPPMEAKQALISYRNALRTTRDAFEADVDSITQKVIAHQRDSFEHSSKVVSRSRLALAFIALIAVCMSISFGVITARELQRARRAWTPSEVAARAMLTRSKLTLVSRDARSKEPQLLGSAVRHDPPET
jgi:hypothetical protein